MRRAAPKHSHHADDRLSTHLVNGSQFSQEELPGDDHVRRLWHEHQRENRFRTPVRFQRQSIPQRQPTARTPTPPTHPPQKIIMVRTSRAPCPPRPTRRRIAATVNGAVVCARSRPARRPRIRWLQLQPIAVIANHHGPRHEWLDGMLVQATATDKARHGARATACIRVYESAKNLQRLAHALSVSCCRGRRPQKVSPSRPPRRRARRSAHVPASSLSCCSVSGPRTVGLARPHCFKAVCR